MKSFVRSSLAVLALSLAVPVVSFAQAGSCPTGFTYEPLPGGGFECVPNASAPEIGASTSYAGLVLVAGMALVIRGRKQFNLNNNA